MLGQASTKDISEVKNPESYKESATIVQQGGKIVRDARKALEAKTGKKVITPLNAKTALKEKNTK